MQIKRLGGWLVCLLMIGAPLFFTGCSKADPGSGQTTQVPGGNEGEDEGDDPEPEPDPDPTPGGEYDFEVGADGLPLFTDKKIERIERTSFMKTPAQGFTRKMRVLVIAYMPTANGTTLDASVTGSGHNLNTLRDKISRMSIQAKFMLEEGSKYKGYANASAKPYLGYEIVDYLCVYDRFKQGFKVPWNEAHRPDYFDVMERVHGEYYVNELGVDEVWLWGWHYGDVEPVESNMASPSSPDISNSERTDDLPVYNTTYVLYNYNFDRAATEAVHNHGHHIEALLMYANQQTNNTESFFLQNFVGWVYPQQGDRIAPIGRCGDTHHPANTQQDYDYNNTTLVESDIMDWKPDGSGEKTAVNCNTWGDIPYAWPDGISPVDNDARAKREAHWYIFWMQNLPGADNGLLYRGNPLNNWMEYVGNWDEAMQTRYTLWQRN